MKYSVVAATVFSSLLNFSASADEILAPELKMLERLVGKKIDHPPLVAFLEDYKCWEDHGRGKSWTSPQGITILMDNNRACTQISMRSMRGKNAADRMSLPKGLDVSDTDETIEKKLGKPKSVNQFPKQFRELIYDGLVVKTSRGRLSSVWLVPPGIEDGDSLLITSKPVTDAAAGLARLVEKFKLTGADIDVDHEGRAAGLSYKSKMFSTRAGEEVSAPGPEGIEIKIYHGIGPYAGAVVVPQTLKRDHWKTFINAYPVAKGRKHLHLVLSYGAAADTKFIAATQNLLKSLVDDGAGK